jgi:hypothetical protein
MRLIEQDIAVPFRERVFSTRHVFGPTTHPLRRQRHLDRARPATSYPTRVIPRLGAG